MSEIGDVVRRIEVNISSLRAIRAAKVAVSALYKIVELGGDAGALADEALDSMERELNAEIDVDNLEGR